MINGFIEFRVSETEYVMFDPNLIINNPYNRKKLVTLLKTLESPIIIFVNQKKVRIRYLYLKYQNSFYDNSIDKLRNDMTSSI